MEEFNTEIKSTTGGDRGLSEKEVISRERTVYLKLVLMPIGLLLVLNAVFQFFPYSRLNATMWPYFLGVGAALACIFAYATYRMGTALDFNMERWIITGLLFILFFWGSFIYLLVLASISGEDED